LTLLDVRENLYGQHAAAVISELYAISHTNMANVREKLESFSLKISN